MVMRYVVALFLCVALAALAQPARAESGAIVTGTVRDAAGNPVPGAFLSLPANSDIIAHEFSDAQGHYSYGNLAIGVPVGPIYASPGPNGPVYPGVPSQDVWGCVGPFTATPGATIARDIVIAPHASGPPYPGTAEQCSGTTSQSIAPQGSGSTPRGWIFGSVTRGGTPLAGVTVRLMGTPIATTTKPDGTYQFPALSTTDGANGGPTYSVAVTPPDGYAVVGPASQAVTVQAGHGVEADFTLRPMPCQFVLGFETLHDAIPAVIGNCADDEQHNTANGDALQHTAHGLLVWRKADNFTAFTDGYQTWVNGPNGIQERLNSQRFTWEANPGGLPVVP
jgi:hypothetical protein